MEQNLPLSKIYNVAKLGDMAAQAETRIQVATVQAMVKRVFDSSQPPSIGTYDCIVVDEAHRGYTLDQEMTDGEMEVREVARYLSSYRRVLDYFDAVKVGMTATPAKHTTEIFGKPVYTYTYPEAVIDDWLIDHEPPILFEQMIGRATRRCDEIGKTVFRIYDPVDIYANLEDVNTMKPLVKDPGVSMEDLIAEMNDPRSAQAPGIAAGIVAFIRQAALGEELIPYPDRVSRAMTKIRGLRPWTPMQLKWLDRIAKQLVDELVIDTGHLNEVFATDGGLKGLDRHLGNQLDAVLETLAQTLWAA